MPELPEVETVRRTLELLLKGDTILDVDVRYEKIIKTDLEQFKTNIKHQTIESIGRKGKHLIFFLNDLVLIVHLRMEGKFFIKKDYIYSPYEHIIFHLENNGQLRYHDVRKFGTMHLLSKKDYLSLEPLKNLGDEPKDIDFNQFKHILLHKKTEIKPTLLDQTIISGLGNIYVDETLFRSKIHPLRKTFELTDVEMKSILQSATEVLDLATKLGGSTIRSYQSSQGITGRFQNELYIHMRKDEPCKVCGTIIKKIKVKGRGTYVCETCQH
jgi:formamidopyrimidine-DNA glycosylase